MSIEEEEEEAEMADALLGEELAEEGDDDFAVEGFTLSPLVSCTVAILLLPPLVLEEGGPLLLPSPDETPEEEEEVPFAAEVDAAELDPKKAEKEKLQKSLSQTPLINSLTRINSNCRSGSSSSRGSST